MSKNQDLEKRLAEIESRLSQLYVNCKSIDSFIEVYKDENFTMRKIFRDFERRLERLENMML